MNIEDIKKINLDIEAKALKKQNLNEYLNLCLKVKICPNCGRDLNVIRRSKESSDPIVPIIFNDGLICKNCGFEN